MRLIKLKSQQSLVNMTFSILQYWIGAKLRIPKQISTGLSRTVLKKLGHLLISQKVRGNTVLLYYFPFE